MRRTLIALGVLLAIAALGVAQYLRPVAAVRGTPVAPARPSAAGAVQLPCPATGSAAIAVAGIGTVGTCGAAAPVPMYSTAKIMTALLVLRDHPLSRGEGGPEVTVSQADVDRTAQEIAADASVVEVAAGEQLSELQLLEGLLIPSGNNLAEILASWDAGSVPAFVAKMNAEAQQLGLTRTHFDDPAGFSEQTTSVPLDLLRLARRAMEDPVFADVVGMQTADLPVAGTVYNIDSELGKRGIAGIKTGSAPHGTASFAGLSLKQVAGESVAIYTAVMGVPDLPTAFSATESLAAAVAGALVPWRIQQGTTVAAVYSAPWGAEASGVAASSLTILLWTRSAPPPRLAYSLRDLGAGARAGSQVGTLTISYGEQQYVVNLVTAAPLTPPGKRYRLTRGF